MRYWAKGGLPTLLEDRAVYPLHAAVGLGPSAADEAVLRAEARDRIPERPHPELVPVVGQHRPQIPAEPLQVCGHAPRQIGGVARGRVVRRHVQLGPRIRTPHVDRRGLPPRRVLPPRVPLSLPTRKQSNCTSSPGSSTSRWPTLGAGRGSTSAPAA